MDIAVIADHPALENNARQLAEKLGLDFTDLAHQKNYAALLTVTAQRIELSLSDDDAPGAIYTDFLRGAALYRRQHGGGRKQLLARAMGLHKEKKLTIYDISAGLGRDAFVLAALGANVLMIERSPIIGALLTDGWQRAQQEAWVRALSWRLMIADSREYLRSLTPDQYPEVIYFDPMFPERKKSALVKKEMRILQKIIGEDLDSPELLALALNTAKNRVVVKRPRLAESIPGPSPSFTLQGQSSRFDIYLTKS